VNNAETKAYLLRWCDTPDFSPFSWCTDGCSLAQHNKFVAHRNENWRGGTREEFVAFVREYANGLVEETETGANEDGGPIFEVECHLENDGKVLAVGITVPADTKGAKR
jgi:hypothetical protein